MPSPLVSGGPLSPWYGERNDTYEHMRSLDYYSYQVGVRLEFPLENRLARSQNTRARVQAAQAEVDLQSVGKTELSRKCVNQSGG